MGVICFDTVKQTKREKVERQGEGKRWMKKRINFRIEKGMYFEKRTQINTNKNNEHKCENVVLRYFVTFQI
jgi:hypothetical protein